MQSRDDPIKEDEEVITLVEMGILAHSDLSDGDNQYRSKADFFVKLFTLLQSRLFLSAVARWGYRLPVAPPKLATIAYAFLAIFIHAFWWCKPKDISTPLTVLNYERSNLPQQAHNILDINGWALLREPIKEENVIWVIWDALRSPCIETKRGWNSREKS